MNNRIARLGIVILLLFIFIVDIFGDQGYKVYSLLCSLLILCFFFSGVMRFRFKDKTNLALIVLNIVFLVLTYKRGYYIINLVFLGYGLWGYITPKILKYNISLLLATAAVTVILFVSGMYELKFPIIILLVYPAYLAGYNCSSLGQATKKTYGILWLNIIFSSVILYMMLMNTMTIEYIEALVRGNLSYINAGGAVAVTVFYFFYITIAINLGILSCLLYRKYLKMDSSAKKVVKKGRVIDRYLTLSIDVYLAMVVVFLGEWIINGDISVALDRIFSIQGLFNAVFLLGIHWIVTSILGRGIGIIIEAIVYGLVLFANYIKFQFFDEPFYPWDTYLVKNALMISKEFLTLNNVVLLTIGVVGLGAALYFGRNHLKGLIKYRPVLAFLPLGIIIISFSFNIMDDTYTREEVGLTRYWDGGKREIVNNGMAAEYYYYLSELDKYMNPKPEDYSYETMKNIHDALHEAMEVMARNTSEEIKPNVVMIMSETFWDISHLKDVTFNLDVTENLQAYGSDSLIVPVFGGGTANTEFEALTGFSSYTMAPGVVPYNVYLRRETPSIVQVFNDNGYNSTAIHANTGSFYNRDKVYNYFGFHDFITIEGFSQEDKKAGLVSDESFVDKVLKLLENKEEPQFIFGISIQNHDSYHNKYPQEELEVIAESELLDEIDENILSNYAQGIYDADKALGKLIESLKESDTPTIVYYFGDHLPRLGYPKNVYEIYQKLGFIGEDEESTRVLDLYRTPLIKWSNYKELNTFDKDISTIYLASDVLKEAGLEPSSYLNVLDVLIEENPVLHYVFKDILSNDDALAAYELIIHDLLFGEQYLLHIDENIEG